MVLLVLPPPLPRLPVRCRVFTVSGVVAEEESRRDTPPCLFGGTVVGLGWVRS